MAARTALAILGVLMLLAPAPGLAQGGATEIEALRREVEALKDAQRATLRELQEIKALLRERLARGGPGGPPPPPQEVVVGIDGAPFKGDVNARVVLVEFADFECPFCARHTQVTAPMIQAQYVATGKIRYVFRDFPLEQIHPRAFKAAEASHCASEQGKYWEMHARLFADVKALARDDLARHARALALEPARFQACLDAGRHAARVRRDQAEALTAGITGTPTFFIGLVEPGGRMKSIRRLVGAQPFPVFQEAIEAALSAAR